MDSCATGDTPEICWFCRKGRHDDCMKNIPTQGKSDGPHDCLAISYMPMQNINLTNHH